MVDFAQVSQAIDNLSHRFAAQRAERQRRRHLEQADFDALRDAGFHLIGVPRHLGGTWNSVAECTRPCCRLLRSLARSDSSLALVSAMHPAVLSYWLVSEEVGEDEAAWRKQQQSIFAGVVRGDWWGTITSEPGSGGDVRQSKMLAEPAGEAGQYLLTGPKHFGSGSGVMRYMVTAAVPAGETQPDWFFVDTQGVPWDGSQGMKLLAEWNGHGMAGTQSHSMVFERFPAVRIAWRGQLATVAARSGGFIGCLFTSVIVGIVEIALELAEAHWTRQPPSSPYEQVEATRATMEGWLVRQAFEGMLRAVEEQDDPRLEVLQGKTAIAELAETLLGRLCRVVGGGTYSRNSPFGYWFEDVRALGFLRPPWPLAYNGLIAGLSQST